MFNKKDKEYNKRKNDVRCQEQKKIKDYVFEIGKDEKLERLDKVLN